MKQARPTVLLAAAVRDATGVSARPGAVLVQAGRVIAAGRPESLPAELVQQAEVIHRSSDLLLPAMVNAHTHLELTDIGPQPYDPAGGFVGWVQDLRDALSVRFGETQNEDEVLAEAVRRGASQAMQAGVIACCDIGRGAENVIARADAGLAGITYAELFGLGPPFDRPGLRLVNQLKQGLQPHAPYSAGPALYEAAARSGRPVTTHLAETREELDFVANLAGPMLDYVKAIGRWHDTFAAHYGKGSSPVQWMRPYLETAASAGGWLVAHCNYVSEDDITILADTNTSVAYCPIASEYFGHKDHRYRDMLAAGINVCLGTDSIVGTDPSDPHPLGLLSAMRRLYLRDGTDPNTLLAMATTHGSKAMRFDNRMATLKPGAPARFACIPIDPDHAMDPLVQALTGQAPLQAISFDV